ncbi:MAG: hypothetical protein NTY01_14070 [Verrucomicrobia bacterium]|nr:hypothetical protein [Verrucomicrobiota bacterium]
MQTLMVSAEHATTGVWLDGAFVDDLTSIGVSGQLNAEFNIWSQRFTYLALHSPDDSFDPRWQEFNKQGHDLAKRLKSEVGNRFLVEHWYYADNSGCESVEAIP